MSQNGYDWMIRGRRWDRVAYVHPSRSLSASWAILEPAWAVLGTPWGPHGPYRGNLGSILGLLLKAENARRPTTFKHDLSQDKLPRTLPYMRYTANMSVNIAATEGERERGRERARYLC